MLEDARSIRVRCQQPAESQKENEDVNTPPADADGFGLRLNARHGLQTLLPQGWSLPTLNSAGVTVDRFRAEEAFRVRLPGFGQRHSSKYGIHMNRGIQSLQATPKTLGPGHAIAFASQMPAYVAEHMDGLRQCGVFSGWLRRFMIVTNANSWFDYGLHLIADTYYEAPVAAHVTPASRSLKIILNNFSLGFLFSGQPIAEYNTGYWESYGARLKKKRYNANGSARQTVVQCLWTSDKMVLIVPILGHLLSGNFSTGGISEDDRIDGL